MEFDRDGDWIKVVVKCKDDDLGDDDYIGIGSFDLNETMKNNEIDIPLEVFDTEGEPVGVVNIKMNRVNQAAKLIAMLVLPLI